jgi:ceramide glucosyltransferase
MSTHDPIQLLITAGLVFSICYYLASWFGARDFFAAARRRQNGSQGVLPTVTVLKPLKGLDVDLYDNLVSFCRQDYPTFQLVFGVADQHDPAVAVVRRLQAAHPEVAIDLVIDGRRYGTNHKVSNLHNMSGAARHDVIVIADSDIRVGRDYLRRIVAPLQDPRVGAVTCLYRAVTSGGMPTLIESLFINTDFSPSVLVARLVETRRYAFGATIALRRSVLAEIGGFLPLATYLADDYYLGHRVAERHYEVALSDVVVETVLAVGSWRRLLEHQLRWARTYRTSRPASYFALVFTYGTLWATLNLLYNHGSTRAAAASALVYGLRMCTAGVIAKSFLQARLRLRDVLLVPIKDLLLSLVWALAFAGDTVHWSGNAFRVTKNGELLEAPATDAAAVPTLAYSASTASEPDPHPTRLRAQQMSRTGGASRLA